MNNQNYELISQHRRTLLQTILISTAVVMIVGIGAYFGFDVVYADKVLPGVQFLDIGLGGRNRDEALNLLRSRINDAKLALLSLEFEGQIWDIDPNEFSFQVETEALVDKAFSIGRRGSIWQRIRERFWVIAHNYQPVVSGVDLVQSFDQDRLIQYLDIIAASINQDQRNAELVIANNRATKLVLSQDGYELDVEQTIFLIAQNIINSNGSVELPVKRTPAKVTLAQTNALGINTLIARGVSDFSGSPKNRRHNIGVGADRFDGIIIKPDETFSFIRALGTVDASTGYLPELVIKEDKTIPEYGGGLCQVSTTAFRAIFNGGFPVVERRNHSYRVVYYEPAGTDATIYQPYPDLKFQNDTPGHILMDTYIEGNKLYFDFYGTDIGQSIELDGPHIYNVTGYPEPIYIDTSALPPGEVQQIESAHRGADAVLYRKVFQNGKLVGTDTFRSHYIPWPAKYLRGVEEAAEVETNLENILPEDVSSEQPLIDPLKPLETP